MDERDIVIHGWKKDLVDIFFSDNQKSHSSGKANNEYSEISFHSFKHRLDFVKALGRKLLIYSFEKKGRENQLLL